MIKKFTQFTIHLGVVFFFLWASQSFALQFLYEKDGVEYYKVSEGKVITHTANVGSLVPQFLYYDEVNRVRYFRSQEGKILEARTLREELSPAPDYDWWYGCSPTAAGMMMGYYDIGGYQGLSYPKLVPGGTAEASTFPPGTYIAQDAIASSEHISDYYVAYPNIGNDPCNGDLTACHGGGNCLADFMGTSQDMYWLSGCDDIIPAPVNADGATTFWNFTGGSKLHAEHMQALGPCHYETSGMYGIGEYVKHAGYSYVSLYNQYIYPNPLYPGNTDGFTFDDFKNEIDAGRPALLCTESHSMLAYGYSGSGTVYVHDTWSEGPHTMTWGGTYGEDGEDGEDYHVFMTALTPAGGKRSAIPGIILPLLLDD
jgi:hypothetical protein